MTIYSERGIFFFFDQIVSVVSIIPVIIKIKRNSILYSTVYLKVIVGHISTVIIQNFGIIF